MKIQCDVCSKKEASVFCSADEAALCDVCDYRVHHANKLASKHQRFSLLHSSSSQFPVCDICQENRALLFCQQDRAILCRECDIPLHTANEHTQKHNRFLLTGIKLSAVISSNGNGNGNGCESGDTVPDFKCTKTPTSVSSEKTLNSAVTNSSSSNSNSNSTISSNMNELNCGGSTSNISEYLIDMLPGWHFEDFLVDSASPAPFGFCSKSGNNHDLEVNEDVLSFFDVENENDQFTCCPTQSESFWVPQATTPCNIFGQPSENHHYKNGIKPQQQQQQQAPPSVTTMKVKRKYLKDDAFTVPEINSSVGSKRTRPLW